MHGTNAADDCDGVARVWHERGEKVLPVTIEGIRSSASVCADKLADAPEGRDGEGTDACGLNRRPPIVSACAAGQLGPRDADDIATAARAMKPAMPRVVSAPPHPRDVPALPTRASLPLVREISAIAFSIHRRGGARTRTAPNTPPQEHCISHCSTSKARVYRPGGI